MPLDDILVVFDHMHYDQMFASPLAYSMVLNKLADEVREHLNFSEKSSISPIQYLLILKSLNKPVAKLLFPGSKLLYPCLLFLSLYLLKDIQEHLNFRFIPMIIA